MPRTDKKKNVWKVAKELIKDPHATVREIAKKTDLSVWAVHNSKKELEQSWTKDPTITYIVNASKKRIERAQRIFDRYLDEIEEKKKLEKWEVSLAKEIVKDDQARITVLWWSVTDEWWWLIVSELDLID